MQGDWLHTVIDNRNKEIRSDLAVFFFLLSSQIWVWWNQPDRADWGLEMSLIPQCKTGSQNKPKSRSRIWILSQGDGRGTGPTKPGGTRQNHCWGRVTKLRTTAGTHTQEAKAENSLLKPMTRLHENNKWSLKKCDLTLSCEALVIVFLPTRDIEWSQSLEWDGTCDPTCVD